MTNPTSNPQVIGAPYTVSQYHQHVAICDKRGYAVAEIAYGTGGMPDVYRALEYACAWRDRLNATPVETSDVIRMRNTLLKAGYADHGGELWKPPLGKNPLPELDRLREETSRDPYKAVCQGGSGGKCTDPDCETCWPEEPTRE